MTNSILLTPNRGFPIVGTVGKDIGSLGQNVQTIAAALDIGHRNTKNLNDSFVRVSDLVGLGFASLIGNRLIAASLGGGSSLVSPLTTKGDVWVFGTTDTRLGVGADNTVLTADSSQPTGLRWGTAGVGPTGATGPAGPAIFLDADPGEDAWPMPGPVGGTGAQGPAGPAVFLDAEPGEDVWVMPGPTGGTGAPGPIGAAVLGLDSDMFAPADDYFPAFGPTQPAYPVNSVQWNNGSAFGGSANFTYDPIASTVKVLSDGGTTAALVLQALTTAGYVWERFNNSAGARVLELLYVGSAGTPVYGAAVNQNVINSSGQAAGLIISTADVARASLNNTGNWVFNAPTSGLMTADFANFATAYGIRVQGQAGVTNFTGNTPLAVFLTGSGGTTDYTGLDFGTIGLANSNNPKARIAALFTGGGSRLFFGTSNSYSTGITNAALEIDENGSIIVGTPAGPARGLGSVNARSYFDDGVPVQLNYPLGLWDDIMDGGEPLGSYPPGITSPFSTGLSGLVPASPGGQQFFLRSDGTWANSLTSTSGIALTLTGDGANPALQAQAGANTLIAKFDANSGGYIAISASATNKHFFGDAATLVSGTANDTVIRAAQQLLFASNGASIRGTIGTSGNWSLNAPGAGTTLAVAALSGGSAITTTGDVAISQQAANTGANLTLNGGPTLGTINRIRYTSNAAANNLFAIRDDTTGVDRLTIAASGKTTLAAPSSADFTLVVNQTAGGANAAISCVGTLAMSADMGSASNISIFNQSATDGRAVVQFRSDLTSSQTWILGLDASGGSTKGFNLRNVTGGNTPLTVTKNGCLELGTPAGGDEGFGTLNAQNGLFVGGVPVQFGFPISIDTDLIDQGEPHLSHPPGTPQSFININRCQPGTFTIEAEQYAVVGRRLQLKSTERATLHGTASLRLV